MDLLNDGWWHELGAEGSGSGNKNCRRMEGGGKPSTEGLGAGRGVVNLKESVWLLKRDLKELL